MDLPDRIEKQVVLRAPIERVWASIADAQAFGRWFGAKLDQPFTPGQIVTGTFDRRFDEAQLAGHQRSLGLAPAPIRQPPPHQVFCTVERMEPPRRFGFRWIPYGIDAAVEPATEPTTLVEFELEPVAEGTRLTITESGFERVPAHRRERAFRMNDSGWAAQAEALQQHVERA